MTLPTAVAVDTPDSRMIHVMTDGVLISMTVTEAQLFQVRLARAIETAAADPELADGPPMMTAKQNRYLHALLGDQGITGGARHAVLSKILRRPIESASELTIDDASIAIDYMQRSARRQERWATNETEAF